MFVYELISCEFDKNSPISPKLMCIFLDIFLNTNLKVKLAVLDNFFRICWKFSTDKDFFYMKSKGKKVDPKRRVFNPA